MMQIRRVYLSGPVSRGVAESQMINWAGLLEPEGISTEFHIFYHKKNEEKYLGMNISEYTATFSGKRYINILAVREITFIFYLIGILLKAQKKHQKIIFQTRAAVYAIPLLFLKVVSQARVIYEIRGAGEEEVNGKESKSFNNRFNDWLMLKMSNKVFTVSGKLLEHKIGKFGIKLLKQKAMIVYGAADSGYFFLNQELRQKKRAELKIEDRLVLLYIGMLDKPWQVPDLIFFFVNALIKKIPELFFLTITPNLKIADEYREKYGIDENHILIIESSQNMLNEYINASDYGLLLRENILVNNVASPTKFAEYLLGGLPVIISEGVGDYSGFTRENNIGLVINNEGKDIDRIVPVLTANQFDRREIQKIGNDSFSKQHFIENLLEVYNNL